LVLSHNITGLQAPFFQTAPDEVILDPNVLASLVEDRVFGQNQDILVVHLELDYLSLSTK
jgi:hypothetical protein